MIKPFMYGECKLIPISLRSNSRYYAIKVLLLLRMYGNMNKDIKHYIRKGAYKMESVRSYRKVLEGLKDTEGTTDINANTGDNKSMCKRNTVENVQPLRTAEEIRNMREALTQTNAPDRNLLLFTIGINTGLRIGDIVRLRIEDVKGRTNLVMSEGKTSKKRTVYLHSVMADIADYLADKDNTGWLFPSRKGDSHISTTQAYRILANAGRQCGYDYVGSHTLRKTFGYHYYQRTKDVATLMFVFNHDSQSTTKRYIGIEDDEVEETLKDFRL